MSDTIVLPIAGLGVLVMPRADFEAALSAGRALLTPAPPPAPAAASQSNPRLLDADQIEALTNIPASWWMAAARTRSIPFRRMGRRVRFVLEEIVACEDFKIAQATQSLPTQSPTTPSKSSHKGPKQTLQKPHLPAG
jgi:hypothetical protein